MTPGDDIFSLAGKIALAADGRETRRLTAGDAFTTLPELAA